MNASSVAMCAALIVFGVMTWVERVRDGKPTFFWCGCTSAVVAMLVMYATEAWR